MTLTFHRIWKLLRVFKVFTFSKLLELLVLYESHNDTYKHTKNKIRKQYTNQYKQYKKTLQNCCTRYNDRVSARIA